MRKPGRFNYSKLYYPTPKEKREFYVSGKLIKWLIAGLVLAGLTYFVFFSSFLSLKNIFYQGSPTPELSAEMNGLLGKNTLLISQQDLQDTLNSKYKIYKNIEIYKGLPDSIKIILNDRQRSLIWQSNSKMYSIDEDGIVYEEIPALGADNIAPIVKDNKNVAVTLGQKIVVPDFIQFTKTIAKDFPLKNKAKIQELSVDETTYNLNVSTDAGWKAIFDTTKDAGSQLDDLAAVLDKYGSDIHEYVDLRIAGRAYYK